MGSSSSCRGRTPTPGPGTSGRAVCARLIRLRLTQTQATHEVRGRGEESAHSGRRAFTARTARRAPWCAVPSQHFPPPASAPLRKRPPPRGGHGLSPWLQATPGGGQLLGSEHFSSHSFTALKRGAVRMLAGQNLSPLCRFCGCQEGACPPRRGRDVVSTRQGPCRRSGTYERQQALIGQIKRYAEISPEVSAVTSGEQSLRL